MQDQCHGSSGYADILMQQDNEQLGIFLHCAAVVKVSSLIHR